MTSTSQEKIRHMSNHFAYVSKSTSFAERTALSTLFIFNYDVSHSKLVMQRYWFFWNSIQYRYDIDTYAKWFDMCRVFSWDVLVMYYTHADFHVDQKYSIRTVRCSIAQFCSAGRTTVQAAVMQLHKTLPAVREIVQRKKNWNDPPPEAGFDSRTPRSRMETWPKGQTPSNLRDRDIGKKMRVPEGPIYAIAWVVHP